MLSIWTAFLNMVFPFAGFLMGAFSAEIFSAWSHTLSGVLLACIGLHMVLQTEDGNKELIRNIHPFLLAMAVSVDTFSVSVSFGMLQLNKILFILSSGILSFIFACGALYISGGVGMKRGKHLRRLSGIALVVMGVMSCFR